LPECFIERPEPAGIATWAENQQPEDRKPKVDRSTPSGPPGYAGHHINTKCDGVYWKNRIAVIR